MEAPGNSASIEAATRSLTVWCLVEKEWPKARCVQGTPAFVPSIWTINVVGVSSAGSGVVLALSSPASSAVSEGVGAADCASEDEAWVSSVPCVGLCAAAPDCVWFSSSAAKAAGILTVVAARAPVITSASAVIDRWDIRGSLS